MCAASFYETQVQIFDVDREMKEEELVNCIYKQNLEDAGYSEMEVKDRIVPKFRLEKRDADVCNWVLECSSKIREELLERERLYVEYSTCRVKDFLAVPRCFKCQGYGHLVKHCKKLGGDICPHCGVEGHSYRDCPREKEDPICVNCKAAKKDHKHRVGTLKCPIYARAVERRVSSTQYNGK